MGDPPDMVTSMRQAIFLIYVALAQLFIGSSLLAAQGGDVDGDLDVDLQDAISGLQALAGFDTATAWSHADINNDHRVGLTEVIYALKQSTPDPFRPVSLQSAITKVQPMTGIVFWSESEHNESNVIQLEYTYQGFDDLVNGPSSYDWTKLDNLLNLVAGRGHQSIIRLYFVYPGKSTTVPAFIKQSQGYNETEGTSEGLTTWFPDWSSSILQNFMTAFFTAFSERYDNDPRLAFLQVGFGLWGEYHIYDGPMNLGQTFPSKEFQTSFLSHMARSFSTLKWSISIDAAETERSPFALSPELLNLDFGLFDDSFLNQDHHEYNADCFNFLSHETRHRHSPMGGELSYYTNHDQRTALSPQGPHGVSFEQLADQYHISYMIGNDQPSYQTMQRIQEAGMSTGYRFQITSFEASSTSSRGVIKNVGIAPLYYDAWPTVNGVRSSHSLKNLAPEDSVAFSAPSGGESPLVTIEADRLVPGQIIEFETDI